MNNQTINELNKRKLDGCYFCIYSVPVTIYFNDGDNFINPKTLIMFFGCNLQGKRRFISSVILEDFSKVSDWYDFFLTFKNRGLNVVLYSLLPNISSLRKALSLAFPEIEIFNSYSDSIAIINRYFTLKYSDGTLEFIKKIFVSKTLVDYEIALDDFRNIYSNSQFLIDLLEPEFINAKKNYKLDFEIRRHLFAFYFFRELSKKLIVISHSEPFFSSVDHFTSKCINIIQLVEKRIYCPKNEWINLINLIYPTKKDLIKCYL